MVEIEEVFGIKTVVALLAFTIVVAVLFIVLLGLDSPVAEYGKKALLVLFAGGLLITTLTGIITLIIWIKEMSGK